ncbi:MAG: hypothetical protein P8075_21910 [Deltaproteobacteria bacterium]
MNFLRALLIALCCFATSCSSQAETSFEKIVTRVDKYFSGQPCLLTSAEITKDGQQVYAYYALKIIGYNLSYDVKNTYSTASPYSGSINLSCNVVDNTRSGDLSLDISALKVTSEIAPVEPSGFSTTSMALANKDFSSHPKSVTFIVRYSYEGGKWAHIGMVAGGMEESVILDLETFPQNKSFREAVGMEN